MNKKTRRHKPKKTRHIHKNKKTKKHKAKNTRRRHKAKNTRRRHKTKKTRRIHKGGALIGKDIDKKDFVKISKGEHGELKTDGNIVCKRESYNKDNRDSIGRKQYKLMEILHNMDISPTPKSFDIIDGENEICMEYGGEDFDNIITIGEEKNLESAIEKLSNKLKSTNLIFVDLCLQFNTGNIVYDYSTKQILLIDIDLKWIRLAKNIPENYWRDILNVYKDYAFRTKSDGDYDGGDPFEHFQNHLNAVNAKYLPEMTLSQSLNSIDISPDDMTPELLSSTTNKLFEGNKRIDKFQGLFSTKGYYNTKTQ
jgi:hypothetical protein